MKKLSLLIIGFLLGLAAMYYYCSTQMDPQDEKVAFVKPSGIITPTQAKGLNANWTQKLKKVVDSVSGRPDNRSAWWSLEDIQDYINYADNQAGSLGYELDGLRVYLGVYPGNAPNGRADYQTMFIVPTGKRKPPKETSEGSYNVFKFSLQGAGDDDIPGGDPLNAGGPGKPPGSGYGG